VEQEVVKHKRGVTLIEIVTVIAILVIIVSLIPHIMSGVVGLKAGDRVIIKSIGVRATLVSKDIKTNPTTWVCRVQAAPGTNPPYYELRCTIDDLELYVER
jgi:prepilin-type N-terminal cleavage/methylation domain-containing protein